MRRHGGRSRRDIASARIRGNPSSKHHNFVQTSALVCADIEPSVTSEAAMQSNERARLPQALARSRLRPAMASRARAARTPLAWILVLAGLLFAPDRAARAGEGDLDTSFGVNGVAHAGVTNASIASPAPKMLVQPDGKVVLCASTYDVGTDDFNMLVARLNADGTPDPTFSFDGRVSIDFGDGGSDACASIVRQVDGKLVVVGFTDNHLGSGNLFAVARLNADGSLDTGFGNGSGKSTVSFTIGGTTSALARAVAIQVDGRIVVAGSAARADSGRDFAVARLLPDGSLDSTFNLTGKVTIGFGLPTSTAATEGAWAVALDAQGRILAAGTAGTRFAIARLNSNGMLDGDFDSDGRATIDFGLGTAGSKAYALVVQHDGKLVLAGQADTSDSGTPNIDMAAVRMQPDGSLDGGFGFQGKAIIAFDLIPNGGEKVNAVVQESDGRLLFGGVSTGANNSAVGAIARLRSNGDLDLSFGASGRHTYDLGFPSASVGFNSLSLQGTRPVSCGVVSIGAGEFDVIGVRLQTELLFVDGFD
jgi:uncharacterized delta-60 repeat protein